MTVRVEPRGARTGPSRVLSAVATLDIAPQSARWRADARPLFLVDGLGAVLSAVLLGLALPLVADTLGTTRAALRTLVVFPLLYAAFDLACVLTPALCSGAGLAVIAALNAAYLVITATVLGLDGIELSLFGVAYFTADCGIVIALAGVELHVARGLTAVRGA